MDEVIRCTVGEFTKFVADRKWLTVSMRSNGVSREKVTKVTYLTTQGSIVVAIARGNYIVWVNTTQSKRKPKRDALRNDFQFEEEEEDG